MASLNFDQLEIFAKHRTMAAQVLMRKRLIRNPDPTAANGWKVGDVFGTPVSVKHVPFKAMFAKIIASCPEGVTLFGVKRTVYAIEFNPAIYTTPQYGLQEKHCRWICIALTRTLIIMYNPLDNICKATRIAPASCFVQRAETQTRGTTTLRIFLNHYYPGCCNGSTGVGVSTGVPLMQTGIGRAQPPGRGGGGGF